MDNFEDNEIKIANYLEDRMSAAEERAFMEELDNDEGLRKQYEEELLVRVLLRENDASEGQIPIVRSQTPDSQTPGSQGADSESPNRSVRTRLVPIRRTYWLAAAAAVLLLIAGSAVFEIMTRKPAPGDGSGQTVVGTHPTDSSTKDAVAQGQTPKNIDTIRTIPKNQQKENKQEGAGDLIATGHGTDSGKLFAEFFTAYPMQRRIPKELAVFFSDYQVGNYDAVIAAAEADYQTGEDHVRNRVLKQYMELFKGLSYLVKDESQPDKALEQFNLVLQASSKTDALYCDGQWYRALSFLKMGSLDKLSGALKDISSGSSPYATKAAALQQRIKK